MARACAKALGNLGVVSDYNGNYEEAVAYHKRALNMQRAVFGRDAVTPDVANSHENLGVALGHRSDYGGGTSSGGVRGDASFAAVSEPRRRPRARETTRCGRGKARSRCAGGRWRRRASPLCTEVVLPYVPAF